MIFFFFFKNVWITSTSSVQTHTTGFTVSGNLVWFSRLLEQQDKWPHEGTNSPWEEEQGQESGLISGIKDTALLHNEKFLTEIIKRFFKLLFLRTILTEDSYAK